MYPAAKLSESDYCTTEERAIINAVIAEEEAKRVANDAIRSGNETEIEAKAQLLGEHVAARGQAIRALMETRRFEVKAGGR